MSRNDKRYQVLSIIREAVAENKGVDLTAIAHRVGCIPVTVQWHICNLVKEGLLVKRNNFTASVIPTPTGWAWQKPCKSKPQELKPRHVCCTDRFGPNSCTHCRAERRWKAFRASKREWRLAR